MTFEQAIPIVEGKLYAYGVMKLEYPQAPVSNAYQQAAVQGGEAMSQQERWVVEHQHEIRDAGVIETTLARMTVEDQRLVQLRYIDRWPWPKVADKLHVSRRTAYRLRDRILMVLAYEFGMLEEGRDQEAC